MIIQHFSSTVATVTRKHDSTSEISLHCDLFILILFIHVVVCIIFISRFGVWFNRSCKREVHVPSCTRWRSSSCHVMLEEHWLILFAVNISYGLFQKCTKTDLISFSSDGSGHFSEIYQILRRWWSRYHAQAKKKMVGQLDFFFLLLADMEFKQLEKNTFFLRCPYNTEMDQKSPKKIIYTLI